MATRHLQKLRAQQADTKRAGKLVAADVNLVELHASGSDDDDNSAAQGSSKPFNPFDLLNDGDDATAEAQESTDNDTEDVQPAPETVRDTSTTKSKRKGKSKRKKETKSAQQAKESAGAQQADHGSEKDEELEALLQRIQEPSESTASAACSSQSGAQRSGLLVVEPRLLRADEELRQMFGRGIVDDEDRHDAARARGARAPKGIRGLNNARRTLRKYLLVQPRPEWPQPNSGLSMEACGTKNGQQLFRYKFSSSYRAAQSAFEECQGTYDPNNMALLWHNQPYHVDCTLAMYDYFKAVDDAANAETTLQRCLFALESAWHPSFRPQFGACALPYEYEENRMFYHAVIRYMQDLSRRGCHRTAMEFGKLLLSMDSSDPVGVLFHIDYFAIRCREFEFLHRFADEFNSDVPVRLLPNFAYSLPLARFYQERNSQHSSSDAAAASHDGTQNTAQHDRSAADMLQHAVILFPHVVPALAQRLQALGAAKDARWQSLLQRALFTDVNDAAQHSATLSHLVALFVEKSHQLWKSHDILQGFLYGAAVAAADVWDAAAGDDGAAVANWACVRQTTYPPSNVNEYRRLRLLDYTDNVAAVPREQLEAALAADAMDGAMLEGDMVQQLQDMMAAMQQNGADVEQLREQLQALRAGPPNAQHGAAQRDVRGANALALFLQSLLPWADVGAADPNTNDDATHQPPQ